MRLIDADALAEEIEKNMKNGFPANEYLSLYAISCIAHAPTVDVLEQIRAEIEEGLTDYIIGEQDIPTAKKMFKVMGKAFDIIDKYIKE